MLDQERLASARLRRGRTRAYVLSVVAIALAIAASGSGLFAWDVQRGAQSRQVAAQAIGLRAPDPHLQAQLALVADRVASTSQGRSALLGATGIDATVRWAGTPEGYLAVSPDGGMVARVGGGQVTVWAGEDLQRSPGDTLTVDAAGRALFAAAVTDADAVGLLAVGGAGGISQVWSTQPTPRLIADLSDGEATTYAMAFDGAGRRLITGDSDGRLALFDLGDPENPARLAVAELGYPITGLAFTPAGRRVVVSGAVDQLVTWRVGDASLEPEQELPFDKQELVRGNDVTLSPDGQWVVASLTQAALLRWRIVGDEFVWADRLTGFGSWVNGAAFSADSSTMLVGSSDQSVSVFDVRTGLKTRTLFGPSPITGVGYAAGRIVATSTDGSLWVWPEGHRILRVSGPPIYQLASDPQGERWLAAGVGGERRVLLWDISSGMVPRQPALAPEGVHLTSSAVIDPRGGWVHAGARGGKVVSWPLTDAGAGSPRVQQLAEEGTFPAWRSVLTAAFSLPGSTRAGTPSSPQSVTTERSRRWRRWPPTVLRMSRSALTGASSR